MGYIRHNAIVVTVSICGDADEAAWTARSMGCVVIGPSEPCINGYRTLAVCPDGSKEGWEESQLGEEHRAQFRDWLDSKRHEDGGTHYEWVEVSYGGDNRNSSIERDAWNELEEK